MNSDSSPAATPRPFSFPMPQFDPSRAQLPSAFVGIPEDFLLQIGHVIGAWSQFDMAFNRLLGCLLAKLGETPKAWETESFKKRSAHLVRTCNRCLPHSPHIQNCLQKIVEDAKQLQIDRNLIAHGHILIKMQTFGVVNNEIQGKLSLHCTGQHAGAPITREYDLVELESVRYDFASLCGRIAAILNVENLHHLQFSPADVDALKLVLSDAQHSSTGEA